MRGFFGCLKKERIEYVRNYRGIICMVVLLSCATMVLMTTYFLPLLLNKVMNAGSFFNENTSLSSFMSKFFPNDLKHSLGIFSSDIGVFFGLTVVFLTFSLIPNDIRSGRVIIPLCAGHSKKVLVFSQIMFNSVLMSFPVFSIYILYYYVGSSFLKNNFGILSAVINGLVLSFSIFAIINITMLLSIVLKKKFAVLAIMVSTIIVLPDVLSFLDISRFLPTYLLTFVYTSNENYLNLIIPFLGTIIIIVSLGLLAIKFKLKLDIDERR